jgi:DNA-damage-inducible protein J
MLYIKCNAIVNTLILSYQERRMAKTATIQTRVDPKIKRNAQKILGMLNISMSEAISLYLTQITLNKGIPFEIKIPNKITAKTLQESENGKNLHKVSDIDELFEELDS